MEWKPGLEGLRGVAAACIVAFHLWLYRDGTPAHADGGLDAVWSGLRVWFVCFFVLSGFLLEPHLARWLREGVRGTLGAFARKRARRILPAYWVAMAGSLLLLWGGSRADGIRIPREPELLASFVVLAQNYLPQTVMSVNPVTWTLSVEVAFYVLLPLIAVALRGRSVATVGLALIAVTIVFDGATSGIIAQKSVGPYLGAFGLGLLAARWRAGRLAAAAGAALVVAWMWRNQTITGAADDPLIRWLDPLPAAAGFAAIIAACGEWRVLAARPLQWLGSMSYGLFLWHVPILLALNRFTDLPLLPWAAATYALALGAAWLSRRYVEVTPRPRARSSRPAARRPRAARLGTAP